VLQWPCHYGLRGRGIPLRSKRACSTIRFQLLLLVHLRRLATHLSQPMQRTYSTSSSRRQGVGLVSPPVTLRGLTRLSNGGSRSSRRLQCLRAWCAKRPGHRRARCPAAQYNSRLCICSTGRVTASSYTCSAVANSSYLRPSALALYNGSDSCSRLSSLALSFDAGVAAILSAWELDTVFARPTL